MVIIFEGLDNCGKDSFIRLLLKYYMDKPVYHLHYSNVKGIDNKKQKEYLKNLYIDSFDLINQNRNKRNLIFNRFYLGEYVYGPLYRGYDGNYVFDLEKENINKYNVLNDIKLIVLYDSVDNLLKRDDGLSHSVDKTLKKMEIDLFIEAYNKSIIKEKCLLNINGDTVENNFLKIKKFLFKKGEN